jgi:NIL domain-containing protein
MRAAQAIGIGSFADRHEALPPISPAPSSARGAHEQTQGKYYLSFPRKLEGEPVLCDIYDVWKVRFVIRQASVSEEEAIMGVELAGRRLHVRWALDYLQRRGVRVDPIPSNGVAR